MDHDVYTTNDAIGLVYVDLSPLFMRTAERDQENRDLVVQGWFPLYDTLRGVRGALCLVIKVPTATYSMYSLRIPYICICTCFAENCATRLSASLYGSFWWRAGRRARRAFSSGLGKSIPVEKLCS